MGRERKLEIREKVRGRPSGGMVPVKALLKNNSSFDVERSIL